MAAGCDGGGSVAAGSDDAGPDVDDVASGSAAGAAVDEGADDEAPAAGEDVEEGVATEEPSPSPHRGDDQDGSRGERGQTAVHNSPTLGNGRRVPACA